MSVSTGSGAVGGLRADPPPPPQQQQQQHMPQPRQWPTQTHQPFSVAMGCSPLALEPPFAGQHQQRSGRKERSRSLVDEQQQRAPVGPMENGTSGHHVACGCGTLSRDAVPCTCAASSAAAAVAVTATADVHRTNSSNKLKMQLLVSVDPSAGAQTASLASPSKLAERRGVPFSSVELSGLQSPALMFHMELTTPQPSPSPSPPLQHPSQSASEHLSGVDSLTSSLGSATLADEDQLGTRSRSDLSEGMRFGWGDPSFSQPPPSTEDRRVSSALSSALPGASPFSPLDGVGNAATPGSNGTRSMPFRTRSCVLPVAVKTNLGQSSRSGGNSDITTYRTLNAQRSSLGGASSRTLSGTSAMLAGLAAAAGSASTGASITMHVGSSASPHSSGLLLAGSAGNVLQNQSARQQLLLSAATVTTNHNNVSPSSRLLEKQQHMAPPIAPGRALDSFPQSTRLPTRTLTTSRATRSGFGSPALTVSSQQLQFMHAPPDPFSLSKEWVPTHLAVHGRGRSEAENELACWSAERDRRHASEKEHRIYSPNSASASRKTTAESADVEDVGLFDLEL